MYSDCSAYIVVLAEPARPLLCMRVFYFFNAFHYLFFMLGIENYALVYAFFGGLCATYARFSGPC